MARPKSHAPKKVKLTLTVDPVSRQLLDKISERRGKSISELLEKWAAQDAEELNISAEESEK